MKKSYSKIMYAVVAIVVMTAVSAVASETDDRISETAKDSYVFKKFLKDDAIKVQSVDDGVVTLTGTVTKKAHKEMAKDTVLSLPGVKSVDNQLKVVGVQADERSDEWLRLKINYLLLFYRHVSGLNTEVAVTDGIVTLQGEAKNEAQKALTFEYVKDINGVKDVKNEMTVAVAPREPKLTIAEKIDDASISSLTKLTLLWHRSTSGLKTTVSTVNGEVTLSGKVKTAAEIDLATKVVSDVKGVTSVVNNMVIE